MKGLLEDEGVLFQVASLFPESRGYMPDLVSGDPGWRPGQDKVRRMITIEL